MTLGFVGFGNMAVAIAQGVIKSNVVSAEKIYAYDVLCDKILEFKNHHNINCADTLEALASACDTIILAVKPQNYEEVLTSFSALDTSHSIFVSIAAGISIDKIKKYLGNDSKVVRVMPNTPLLLGYGATALCRCNEISDEEFKAVCKLFECSGITEVLSEDKMNEIIAVNGSSPAYLFLFAKAVCDYAESCGISREAAKNLFAQTMIGSAKMITDSGDELQTLIDKVTSKGGTTAKALECFYNADFEGTIKAAMDACVKRANELG